ncbi:MAG: pilus assembly PilX N-terminal domain-containing protein [Longimicrobiales bacterium]
MEMDTRDRNGFALPAALLAMVVIGAAVTGGFYAASQENRISSATAESRSAFYVAEYGVQETLATTYLPWYDAIPVAGSQTRSGDYEINGRVVGEYDVAVRRLGTQLFLISSVGRLVNSGRGNSAERTVAQVVRTDIWNMPMNAALHVNGPLTVTGNAYITGSDLDSGLCHPDGDAVVSGVVVPDSSQVSVTQADHLVGDPPVEQDTTMTGTSLLEYGETSFDELAAMATHSFAAGTAPQHPNPVELNGQCDMSVATNWGDPYDGNVCANYYPIIHIQGDAHFSNGRGQGVLLIEGSLQMTGNFEYDGIVVVKGGIRSTGNGNHIDGVVMVNNGAVELDTQSSFTAGSSVLQFSSCNAQRAMTANIRARPIATRSWFDVSSVAAGE